MNETYDFPLKDVEHSMSERLLELARTACLDQSSGSTRVPNRGTEVCTKQLLYNSQGQEVVTLKVLTNLKDTK
jgi:hypothetical protein